MPTSLDPQPDDDEVECAHCGAIIRYDLSRCPNCGVNLYEPDDEAEDLGRFQTPALRPKPGSLGAKLGGFFRRLLGQPHPADELFGVSPEQMALYTDLRRKVGGDSAVVERLIDFERQQRPKASRLVWLQAAIQRWEQDNR
jgi:hypothetical protein